MDSENDFKVNQSILDEFEDFTLNKKDLTEENKNLYSSNNFESSIYKELEINTEKKISNLYSIKSSIIDFLPIRNKTIKEILIKNTQNKVSNKIFNTNFDIFDVFTNNNKINDSNSEDENSNISSLIDNNPIENNVNNYVLQDIEEKRKEIKELEKQFLSKKISKTEKHKILEDDLSEFSSSYSIEELNLNESTFINEEEEIEENKKNHKNKKIKKYTEIPNLDNDELFNDQKLKEKLLNEKNKTFKRFD